MADGVAEVTAGRVGGSAAARGGESWAAGGRRQGSKIARSKDRGVCRPRPAWRHCLRAGRGLRALRWREGGRERMARRASLPCGAATNLCPGRTDGKEGGGPEKGQVGKGSGRYREEPERLLES